MLRQRSLPARVTHEVSEPSPELQARVVNFQITTPAIIVETVHLTGIAPEFASDLRARAAKVSGTLLDDGLEHRSTNDRLLLPYLDAGYITAHIADRKLTPIASSPDRITLDLAGTVVPGPLLRVGTLTWAGTPELSPAAFAAAAPLKHGAPASASALAKTTDLLAAPFRKEGYADVIVNATPSIDTAANTVSYTFAVIPGEQYRIRSIKPENLTPAQQTDFDRGWRMKAADLFNPDYITHFLEQNTALRSFDDYSATYRAERDPAAHLVDVTVTFMRGAITAGLR